MDYVQSVFNLKSLLKKLRDGRKRHKIPIQVIWKSVFFMFLTRLKSLNKLEIELGIPGQLTQWTGGKASADAIGDAYCVLDPDSQREILWAILQKLKRNKVINSHRWGVYLQIVDQHEFFSSRRRSCPECLRRTVTAWDVGDLYSYEGVNKPLRVLHTEERTTQTHHIDGGKPREFKATKDWWWATSFRQERLSTRTLYQCGHHRWDIDSSLFQELASQWGLDHNYRHHPTAILNFTLTLLIAYTLLRSFYHRNLKPAMRKKVGGVDSLVGMLQGTLRIGPTPEPPRDRTLQKARKPVCSQKPQQGPPRNRSA